MEKLTVVPFKDFVRASVLPVGSKSITNRALILAAIKGGKCKITGALFSRDTEIMMSCLQKLGFEVSADKITKTIEISGRSIVNDTADLFVGNAGTAARFLTAFVASKNGGEYFFDSDEAMYKRPMKGLVEALQRQGTQFEFIKEYGHFPFKMYPHGLKGGSVQVDASESSQIVSALMMAFSGDKNTTIDCSHTVSAPFVKMTEKMLGSFPCDNYSVEPDATAASYFIMLPVIAGGVCEIENFGKCVLQGDAAFVSLMESAGFIKTKLSGDSLLVFGADKFTNEDLVLDFNDISDTFLTLAAACAFIPRKIKITGIAHTRKQETDRVSAMASQLAKVCKSVIEENDSLEIVSYPACEKCSTRAEIAEVLAKNLPNSTSIETYNDHRIAMSFAILGCANIGRPWLEIENPACVSKTWREFFDVLDCVRKSSEKFRVVSVDGGAAVGKSSVSRESSATLDYMHVDTGAHYRTLAYILLENGVEPEDTVGVRNVLETLKLSTTVVGNTTRILCSSKILEDSDIRNERINAVVSKFASNPDVRDFLKNYQRSMAEFAKEQGYRGMIMEGRDIGSIIFPDADTRIFLDADEQTRALRRAKEGITDSIKERDALDKKRKVAPLVCPQGAHLIDTSNMSKDEVVAKSISLILKS